MNRRHRNPTTAELAKIKQHRAVSDRSKRAATGIGTEGPIVEEIQFKVSRVWSGITCSGPPCCPATWLIETTDGEYLEINSWFHLVEIGAKFPGEFVTVTILPESRRIISAETSGNPVTISVAAEELLWDIGCETECVCFCATEEVPADLRRGA